MYVVYTCVQTCVAVYVCAEAHSHVCRIKSQGINSGYLKFYKCICFLSSFFIYSSRPGFLYPGLNTEHAVYTTLAMAF